MTAAHVCFILCYFAVILFPLFARKKMTLHWVTAIMLICLRTITVYECMMFLIKKFCSL